MKISDKLKEIMQDINSECNTVSPRALKIYELINYNQTFENAQNLIASFNKRKYSFKYMAAELLWYLS
jgi:thymidylate synthase